VVHRGTDTAVRYGGHTSWSGPAANGTTYLYRIPTATSSTIAAASSPPPRVGHGMVYDPVRDLVVVAGGTGMADLWEFNGTAWSEVTPTNPTPQFSGTNLLQEGPLTAAYNPAENTLWFMDADETWSYSPDTNAWTYRGGGLPPVFIPVPFGAIISQQSLYWDDEAASMVACRSLSDPACRIFENGAWQVMGGSIKYTFLSSHSRDLVTIHPDGRVFGLHDFYRYGVLEGPAQQRPAARLNADLTGLVRATITIGEVSCRVDATANGILKSNGISPDDTADIQLIVNGAMVSTTIDGSDEVILNHSFNQAGSTLSGINVQVLGQGLTPSGEELEVDAIEVRVNYQVN
jgi:hypothetical protein